MMTDGKKFGFGCMRLPLLKKEDQTSFDFKKIDVLFDRFLEKGFTYFDTAYTYHNHQAEAAVRKALVERHPRESYELATKLPLRDFKDEEDLSRIFQGQLSSCGVDYFDYYLIHNMGSNVYAKSERYHVFDFVKAQKDAGLIKYIGMSFHDQPELLDTVLAKYGKIIDFVQLQINYIDWEDPTIQSRNCLAISRKYHKPVMVMEPCKGGTLVNIPEAARQRMRAYAPEASIASWALRFAAGQEGVIRVLSGMNSMEQVEENTETFLNFKPLNSEEQKIIQEAVKIIRQNTVIACTACGYCTSGCPKNIMIPSYFALYNSLERTTGSSSSQVLYYHNISIAAGSHPKDCIACGQCEKSCPQHLPVRQYLKEVAQKFESSDLFPKMPSK
ncbi:aldo/keto reductase [Eubacterium sp.]|uniref:aldo/keto reductase n=1 Tax=Eubacterium sp. TaxID=142586 RepID=UPI002FC64C08